MKKVKKYPGIKIFAVVFLLFITVSAVSNANLMTDTLTKVSQENLDFKGFIEEVKTAYTSDIKMKDAYINLNGLFARLTGRTVYNDVAKLNNGMLISKSLSKFDTEPGAEKISEFNKYLSKKGIKYLYVQAPYKVDLEHQVLPEGVTNYANINADRMVLSLKEKGVNVLDLRDCISANAEDVNKYYYSTDHHWNNDGAFIAFQKITEKIDKLYKNKKIKSEFLNKDNWEAQVYEDIFLGSLGKRVGKYFAGTDDVVYYKPKAETQMALYNSKYNLYLSGDFDTVNKREANIEKDYFSKNPYAVYIGGDYPIVKHINNVADSDIKILFIKDSYALAVQAFLSTVFSRIDVIDPRHIKAYSISEYVECYEPDIVIQMMNPSVFRDNEYYEFKTEECEKFSAQKPVSIIKEKKCKVSVKGKKQYVRFKSELSPKTKYTFKFRDIDFLTSEEKRMTVALYNAGTNEIIDSHIFDLEFDTVKGLKEWTFITPEYTGDDIQLLVYAGEYKNIKKDKIIVRDAQLIEYR